MSRRCLSGLRRHYLPSMARCDASSPNGMRHSVAKWSALCLLCLVMIVAWEMGYYLAMMRLDKKQVLSNRDERVHQVLPVAEHNEPVDEQHNERVDEERKEPVEVQHDEPVEDVNARVERRQSQRRRTLESQCKELGLPRDVSSYTIRHFIVVEKYKLAYCFIPKIGCSNWKRVMMVLDNQTKSVDGLTSDEVHINARFKYLFKYSEKDQKRILSEYQTFFFVRHPFERLLSVYKNKLQNLENYRHKGSFQRYGKEIVKQWRTKPSEMALRTGENVTLAEFIKYLVHVDKREKFETDVYASDHWREMYKICSPCAVNYSFIGRLEDVATEADYLINRWGARGKVRYLGAESSRPTNSSDQVTFDANFLQVDGDDLMKLWRIFRNDFLLFEYSKPWFL